MKRSALALGMVGASVLVLACSGGADEPLPLPTEGATFGQALEQLTGARWKADRAEGGSDVLYFSAGEGTAVLPNLERSPNDALALLAPFYQDLGVGPDLSREFLDGEVLASPSDESVGIYRFAQHVPGTEIPVLDGDLSVAVTLDGKLAYVSTTHARGLDRMKTTPALSKAEVKERAPSAMPGGFRVTGEPVLGIVMPGKLDAPRLAYRITLTSIDDSVQLDVDANDGTTLRVRSLVTGAKAFSAAHYYDHDDLRYERAGAKTVYATPSLTMETSGPTGNIVITGPTGKVVECTASADDATPMECDTEVPIGGAKGAAVDAQHNILAASKYFASQLGHRRWADEVVRASVNVTTLGDRQMAGDGFFRVADTDIKQNQLFLGIGKTYEQLDPKTYAGKKTYAWYPVSTSLDFVTHEYAHGVVRSITPLAFEGEAGAINEALSDIFAAHAEALTLGHGDSLFKFADDVRGDGRPLRDFRHPSRGADVGGAAHYSQRKPTVPEWVQLGDKKTCRKNDCGNVHYNSTIVSNAWSLLATGGFNEQSGVGVLAEVGLSRATRLFWETLPGTMSDVEMKTFAHHMISTQIKKWAAHPYATDLEPMWVKRAVVCAWNAVGVIPDAEVAWHGIGWTCPTSTTVTKTCKGKADGAYCNPDLSAPYDAYHCKNGALSYGTQCVSGTFCHRTSDSPSSPAVMEGGKVKCFSEPQDR